jgi:hypothetical protein
VEAVMKKALLVMFLFSVIGSAFMSAQDAQSPFSWDVKKNKEQWTGEALYKNKTLDETWAATVKALMRGNYKTIKSDKGSGTMTILNENSVRLELLMEKTDNGTAIVLLDATAYKDIFGTYKKIYRRLLESIAVNLYGEDVIPKK